MSDTHSRTDFSAYDAMTTQELEALLRADCNAPEGEGSDTETILYIMEVLAARRKKEGHTGKTAREAFESFQEHYLSAEQSKQDTAPAPRAPRTRCWVRRAIAAAAVLAVLVCVPLAASALGWEDIWNAVAQWAKETFSFVSGGQTELTEPSPDDTNQYSSLQQALAETNRSTDMIPTWIPEGYELEDITILELPDRKTYVAGYRCEEKTIVISVQSYLNTDPERIEINDEFVEIYNQAETDYYIFENVEQFRAVWIQDSYECYISGELTMEEIKLMIDSIGKG